MATRRDMLKLSLLAGGTALAAPKKAFSQLCLDDGIPSPLQVSPSPPTRPFVDPLYIPPIAQPVPLSSLVPGPDPARHQRWHEFLPQKYYVQREQQFLWSYHRDLPLTPTWGWDGSSPGATFHARYGEPIFVRRYNDLPLVNALGYGLPSTTIHLHNSHTASESDGYPLDFKDPGSFWDHHYPNVAAGNDERERMTSLWYHDHRMDFTAPNVYAGLSGFYFLFDERDSNNENDTNPRAWRLPSGRYDVPLMLHDVLFDEAGRAIFNPFQTDGWLGDKMTVNRKIQPYFQVEPRKYRFRIQNGGPSRYYQLFLSTGQKFVVVTSDGNFLEAPVEQESVTLAVAERHDVIIDFSRYKPGDQVVLLNRLEQTEGRGPTGRLLDPGEAMMRFDVVPATRPDPSRIPSEFRPLPPVNFDEVARERTWVFDYDERGLWTINGLLFDHHMPSAEIQQGTAEVWTIRNAGANWSHPVHIHFEEFQILEWNGRPLAKNDVRRSRKDVINLGPNDEVKIFMRFRDFLGKYVMHCHNVVHEDHAMMIRWDIVP
jgi:FtsP/CotA-like multicopper oxidase with cupredoxin domain